MVRRMPENKDDAMIIELRARELAIFAGIIPDALISTVEGQTGQPAWRQFRHAACAEYHAHRAAMQLAPPGWLRFIDR